MFLDNTQTKFNVYLCVCKKLRCRSQLWTDFHEIHMVGASPLMGETYCFWKQSAQYNHRYGRKCGPKTSFSGLSQPVWVGYIHFRRQTPHSLQKRLGSQKWFLAVFSENCSFFWKNYLIIKYSIAHLWLKKSYVKTSPFPKKLSNAPQNQFFSIFSKNTAFIKKIVEHKNIQHLISDKKGYIHF